MAEARARASELKDWNLFITMTDEEDSGEVVAVKDLVDVRGTPTTAGSVMLPREPKASDAPLVRNLRRGGCAVIGKANLHEWAFGSTNINQHYGTVRNPRDPTRIAGGSSGGSAAAVAAGVCDWAVGSDTGGSIRIPAGLCGVVGFKPTLNLIDTTGVVPLSASLDTIGSLAPNVATAARAVAMMAGLEDLGATGGIARDRPRLGIPANWVSALDGPTQAAWELVSAGLPEVELPDLEELQRACLDIMFREAAAFHRQWLETRPETYAPDVLARLRSAAEVTEADYARAVGERGRFQAEVARAMRGLDAILLPATACVAPTIGDAIDTQPLARFTRPFNLTGQPVFSLPAPMPGLPVGIQVVGHFGRDADLVGVVAGLEAVWARSRAAA